jgi:hypothetical protein
MSTYNRIFEVRSGNIIGAVEESVPPDPGQRTDTHRLIKIGVIDSARCRREHLSEVDARVVIDRLRQFVSNNLKGDA